MPIKLSSIAVVVAALLVAGTLVSISANKQKGIDPTTAPQLAGTQIVPPQLPVVDVGWLGPLTDSAPIIGQGTKSGVELAQQDLNAHHINIIYRDTACDITTATEAVNQLIQQDQVQAIINSTCLAVSKTVTSIAEQAHVVTLSPLDLSVILPSRGSDEFIARYKEIFGASPPAFAAQGYDAFVALARAIEQGADSGPLIRDQLRTIQFAGASGYIQFNTTGNIDNDWEIIPARPQDPTPLLLPSPTAALPLPLTSPQTSSHHQ